MEMTQSTLALSPSTSCNDVSFGGSRLKKRQVLLIVFVGTVAAAGGFLLGYFLRGGIKESNEENSSAGGSPENRRKDIEVAEAYNKFKRTVRTRELEDNLRFFSQKPHVAGSPEQLELANYLASKWREYEFDEVETIEYKVLLSYPMENNPNVVSIVENGTIVEEMKQSMEVSPSPGDNNTSLYNPYLAYTPNGTAEGPLVYVNRGTKEDFDELEKRNVSLNGTILLSRNIFGMKVTSLLAIPKGAKGILIYPDLEEYAKSVPYQNTTYPGGPLLSPKAVMSAQMYTRYGDPLTPGFPSLDGIYRRKKTDIKDIPPILVQPISYGDARWLLQQMTGDEVPPDWRGDQNVTYRFGPGFIKSSRAVRLSVHNQLKSASIYNVIGTITGREQPDRYVFLGNHRDAWFYGAADASTGASVLTETSRVLGVLLKGGWRPRRTIKLCSFGGEEFGLLGSVEWVEENAKILKDRGVAYLNTDVPVQGDYVLLSQTSPLLNELILKWTKLVKVPAAGGTYESIHDVMLRRTPSPINPGEPNLLPFRFISDYIPFYFIAGITAADFSYFFNYANGSYQLYPTYHTQEDTFYWVKNFADPHFQIHRSMTLLLGGMLLDLADAKIIPFNVTWLKQSLSRAFNRLNASSVILANQLKRSLEEFSRSCDSFQSHVEEVRASREKIPTTTLRTINDQLSQLEKAFIDSRIFNANSVIFKHVAFSDSFHGVLKALASSLETNDTTEVQKQLSIVSMAISSAAKILKPIVIPSK